MGYSPNFVRYTHLKTVSEANSYLTKSNTNESGSLFSHFVNKNCLFNFGEKFFEVKTLLFTISALPDFRTPFYTKRTEKRQKGQISRKKSRNTCAQFLFLKKNFWKNLSNDKKIKYQVSHQVLTVIDQKMCKFHGRRKNS